MFKAAARYAPALQNARESRPIPIVGPSSPAERSKLGPQRSINWFPVKPEREGDAWQLRGRPGLEEIVTLPRTALRGFHVRNERLFVVAGPRLYEVYDNGLYRPWGLLPSRYGRVCMAALGTTMVIGDDTHFYAVDMLGDAITQIPEVTGGRFCKFFNQRMLYHTRAGQVYYSELNDATDIPGLNYFTAESLPDQLVAIETTEDQVWLIGKDSTETWQDVGNGFQRIPGGVVFLGCEQPDTIMSLDNSIWMVGRNKEGAGIVWRSNGINFQRVSTAAVERFCAASETITALSYQEQGETFYCLNSERGSWCYGIRAQEWHERAWLNRQTGEQERQRAEFHAYCYGLHMVGDYESGKIYRQGLDLHSDDGQEIRRTRITPRFSFGGRSVIMDEVWLDFATGVGIDGSGQGEEPKVMLRSSGDGASFGSEITTPLGAIGEYDTQVRFFGLGLGRDWVLEISVSDPVFTGLMGGEANYRVGRR